VYGVAVVTHRVPDGTRAEDLRKLVLDVRNRLDSGRPAAVAVCAVVNDRPVIVIAVNELGREWGVKAGELVRAAAAVLGGGGGGKDDVAQGGGSDPTKVTQALEAVEHAIGQRVTGHS
jgi:alanyl-tRNA synthetase